MHRSQLPRSPSDQMRQPQRFSRHMPQNRRLRQAGPLESSAPPWRESRRCRISTSDFLALVSRSNRASLANQGEALSFSVTPFNEPPSSQVPSWPVQPSSSLSSSKQTYHWARCAHPEWAALEQVLVWERLRAHSLLAAWTRGSWRVVPHIASWLRNYGSCWRWCRLRRGWARRRCRCHFSSLQ